MSNMARNAYQSWPAGAVIAPVLIALLSACAGGGGGGGGLAVVASPPPPPAQPPPLPPITPPASFLPSNAAPFTSFAVNPFPAVFAMTGIGAVASISNYSQGTPAWSL